MNNNDFILERISETIFSSGKLTVNIYSLLNDKGSSDGKAYPAHVLNKYTSTKYSNGQVLGEFNYGRNSLILGFSYIDRSSNPMIRESVNFGEDYITSQDVANIVAYEQHIIANFNSIFVQGINNTYTIDQSNSPLFEIKNSRGTSVNFTPVIVNRISNGMTVPSPGIRVGIVTHSSYFEDITFSSFQYLAGQLALYNSHERLAALKDTFKLTALFLGKYRVSEPRGGGNYQNFGQTRNSFGGGTNNSYYGGQFSNGSNQGGPWSPQGNPNQQPAANPWATNQQPMANPWAANQQPTNNPAPWNTDNQLNNSPFANGDEGVGSNPFAREEEAPVASANPRFRRATNPEPVGSLNIDKTATVKTEKSSLEELAKEANEAPATNGSGLNSSILVEIDKMTKEDSVDLSDLDAIYDSIK